MIIGIVSAILNEDYFCTVMDTLLATAKGIAQQDAVEVQERHTSQVHALNCLRAVLLDSRFGDRVSNYVGNSLDLAVDCLSNSR